MTINTLTQLWASYSGISMSCSSSSLAALPVVINTRPVERAAPLTCHLQAAGFTVVDMPMLALQSRSVTNADIKTMQQWLAGEYQALVIVSPTAAASGLAVWQTLELERYAQDVNNKSAIGSAKPPSHLIAVGEATAAVLNNVQLPAANKYQVLQPAIANNEGMLVMPEIESLQAGDKLLVWRGLGGRRLLVDTLQARGVHIDSIAWYERVMPTDANVQYEQWSKQFSMQKVTQKLAQPIMALEQAKPIVVISSGTAFEHWASIVDPVQALDSELKSDVTLDTNLDNGSPLKLSDFAYVVLGERLAHMVAEQQLSYWRVEDLAPETILAAIQQEG